MGQESTPLKEVSGGSRKRVWIYAAITAIALSLFALAIVVGNVAVGAPHEPDENASAHLFQLAMVAQAPLLVLFLATADWSQRKRVMMFLGGQILAAAAALLVLAWSGY